MSARAPNGHFCFCSVPQEVCQLMWSDVLTFWHQLKETSHVRRGHVVGVDPSLRALRVKMEDASETTAWLSESDGVHHLYEIVRLGGDCVRIDCRVDMAQRRVVEMILATNSERLDDHIADESLPVELALVSLVVEAWRSGRVPYACHPPDPSGYIAPAHGWKHDQWTLHATQKASCAWMRHVECATPKQVRYAHNIKVSQTWFVDVKRQCLTRDPSWQIADLAGAICSDGVGMGKTATALHHAFASYGAGESTTAEAGKYVSQGSLVILPINLVSQWRSEIAKFFDAGAMDVVWLIQGSDLKNLTIQHMCRAHLVVTTFHFLRGSKPYSELVEEQLGTARSSAALCAWARRARHTSPVVEAVYWQRVIIDEVHQVLDSARDLRYLSTLLRCRTLWGLTATPGCHSDRMKRLHHLLVRSESSHPNLLAAVVETAVCGTEESRGSRSTNLHLVCSSRESLFLQDDMSVEEAVRCCTKIDVSDTMRSNDVDRLEKRMRAECDRGAAQLRARIDACLRTVKLINATLDGLSQELKRLSLRGAGDELAIEQAAVAADHRRFCLSEREGLIQTIEADRIGLERDLATSRRVTQRVEALRTGSEVCSICMDRPSSVIAPCAHIFCATCIRKHLQHHKTCPECRKPLSSDDVCGIVTDVGSGKMRHIRDTIRGIAPQPVVFFVQWKSMVKAFRAYLRGDDLGVLVLDGNAAQRASALAHFAQHGGVLLLCLEDPFDGLDLSHAKHIVFAHALVGDRSQDMERQAVARCARPGQMDRVNVVSFVVAETAEETLWRQTHYP